MNGARRTESATATRVPDIGGPTAPAAGAVAPRRRVGAAIAPLRKFEPQRPGHRIRVGKAERQPLAEAIGLAGLVADKRARRFVVAEIFLAQVLGEDQPVAAEVLDGREKAERLDAGDPALDQLPDAVGEERRHIT